MLDFIFSKHLWTLAFLPGVLLALFARWRFSWAYRRYATMPTAGKVTGASAARILLDRNGMANVELYEGDHPLGAHHDPRRRCVFLSPDVVNGRSVATIAVAAHGVGHAIQMKREHRFLHLRMMILSATGKITLIAFLLVVAGLLASGNTSRVLLSLASGTYLTFITLHLLTLAVEYRAGRLVIDELLRLGIIETGERIAFRRMLNATAWMDTPQLLVALLGPLGRFVGRGEPETE